MQDNDLSLFLLDEQAFAEEGAWPTRSTGPSLPAQISSAVEDFCVDEIPAYLPSGSGDHLFVHLEKREISTLEAVQRVADATGISARDIGFAGRKDARGLCRQWISLPRGHDAALPSCESPQLKILETQAHGNKLRLGHLHGNRFTLRVLPLPGGNEAPSHEARLSLFAERVQQLQSQGLPNYYGPQRFGHDGRSAQRGAELLLHKGKRGSRRGANFLISALQSLLFNDYLAARLRLGQLRQALDGDVLQTGRGGLFVCEDPAIDTSRLQSGELRVSGPMFGKKMRTALGSSLTLESEILAARGLSPEPFLLHRPTISGSRRPLSIAVEGLEFTAQGEAEQWSFSLPAGSYATIAMRELYRYTML